MWERIWSAASQTIAPERRTWLLGFASIVCALVVGLSGCTQPAGDVPADDGSASSTSPAGSGKRVIGLSVQYLTNPFFKVIAETVTSEAAKHGFEVIVRDADQKIELQKDQVKEFIVKRVDAIILCPCNTKAIGEVIKEANAAGIPVFTIDTKCEDPTAEVVHHVGTDNVQGGEVAAQAMIDALGEAGGKVAILEYKQVESCLDRVKGFRRRIDQYNRTAAHKIEIVGQYESRGSKEIGQNAAREAIIAHPDLKGIFAINDPAALGALAALEAEGKADQIVIVGFDGQPEAKVAIREGKLFDSPVQFPDRMAVESVRAIVRYFNGEAVEPELLIPTEPYRREQALSDPSLPAGP